MTFSILARDPQSGAIGGAAATGSLCVGGWVLRGDLSAGMSCSQGASPSTFWGEDVLTLMRGGLDAAVAVDRVTSADRGCAYRQLSALDLRGQTGAFTGESNEAAKGYVAFSHGIVAGNMLTGEEVLTAMAAGYENTADAFDRRLLRALQAANRAGGDYRGLLSAALLVFHPDRAPLDLRIDFHAEDPIGALELLLEKATCGDYAAWARQVPTPADRERTLD